MSRSPDSPGFSKRAREPAAGRSRGGRRMNNGHLKWSFNLSSRMAELEGAHRELEDLYGRILQVCEGEAPGSNVRERIRSFLTYARWHFVEEEALMRHVDYTGYRDHKADHQRLLQDAEAFIESFGGVPRPDDGPAIVSYFKYWLIRHMAAQDSDLVKFLNTLKSGDC